MPIALGSRVRLVLDTNVALSGLIWHGAPGLLIDAACAGRVSLATSVPLLAELRGVITRARFAKALQARGVSAEVLFAGYAALAERFTVVALASPVARDPSDDEVLACAVAARCDLVVSGDDDLLTLGMFCGIPIVRPAQALEQLSM